eukprot:18170-Pleurochrysis_carterae.AAC.1
MSVAERRDDGATLSHALRVPSEKVEGQKGGSHTQRRHKTPLRANELYGKRRAGRAFLEDRARKEDHVGNAAALLDNGHHAADQQSPPQLPNPQAVADGANSLKRAQTLLKGMV